MTKYHRVRTFSFEFRPEVKELPFEVFSLEFPAKWKRILISLQADTKGRSPEETSLPIKTLNKSLRTLIPDLISISRYAGRLSETDWLFSRHMIPTEVIWLIIQQWVNVTYANHERLLEVLKVIKQVDLVWQQRRFDLAQWRTTHYDTAEHEEEAVYTLLPDYLASLLSRPEQVFLFGTYGPRALRRVPKAPGGRGAELISWPPFRYQPGKTRTESDKDKKANRSAAFFSVYVKLTLQTVPFDSRPFIHLDIGLKRWLGGSTPVRFRGSVTTYLSTKVPWSPQLESIHSLQPAPLHWQREADGTFMGVWGDLFAQIISNLNKEFSFPDANALVSAPETGLSNEDDIAAISYSTQMSSSHSVAAGLMPHDHHLLMKQIADAFTPCLQLIAPLQRQPYKAYKKPNRTRFEFPQTGASKRKSKPWAKPKTDQTGVKKAREKRIATPEDKKALRAQIAAEVSPIMAIELHVQATTTRQQLAWELAGLFGITIDTEWNGEEDLILETEHLTLHLSSPYLGKLGTALLLDEEIKNHRDRREDAIKQRIDEVKAELNQAVYPTLAIIELDGKDSFPQKGTDPKAALRIGFAQTGRHSQFLAAGSSSKSPLLERIRKAYLDGLRHLGIRPFSPAIQGMKQTFHYCALSFIVQNRQTSHTGKKRIIPILVYMKGDTGEVFAYVEKEREKGIWLPYSQALLAFAFGNIKTFDKDERAFGYIYGLITKEVLPEGDVIVLCDASKTRRFWTWWQNKNISQDQWSLYPHSYMPIRNTPGLRFVRLRGGTDGETPHGYAMGEGEQIGFTEGLFKHSQRVYYSIQSKPKQFPLSPNMSKLESWSLANGLKTNDPRPDKPGWNPTLYEIVVAAIQKEDQPELIAALMHELRKASVQFDEATAAPVPLHLANLMEEYILEALSDDEEDD